MQTKTGGNEMRRAINTIPENEYNQLLREAASRMRAKIQNLIDDEEALQRKFDDQEDYATAERHDFNSRALRKAINAIYITRDEKLFD